MKRGSHMNKPTYLSFDKASYPWKNDIDYRKHPELYRVGKGEQGVLICEPYKSELVAYWRFKNPELAEESSQKLYQCFETYLEDGDFVGADMARKFLQMGFTRARRYTNYKGGRKYAPLTYEPYEKGTGDQQKAMSATIFYHKWQQAEAHPLYASLKKEWKKNFG